MGRHTSDRVNRIRYPHPNRLGLARLPSYAETTAGRAMIVDSPRTLDPSPLYHP